MKSAKQGIVQDLASVCQQDLILLSIYTSGRDVKNFPKPNEFWPHRWTRDAAGNYKGVSNPFAYLPFAMGARSCVGQKIADTQMALTMAKVRCSDRKHYKI